MLLLIPADAPAQAGSAAGAEIQSGAAADPVDWAAIRPPQSATINLRRVIGTLLLAPAVTLLALYLFHRRPYILAWVASWVALGAMVSLLSFEARDLRLDLPDDRPLRVVIGRLIAGGWALCGVIYAGFLLWGGVWFRSPAFMPRRVFAWVGALAAWFVVVALVPALPLAAILAPTFVIVGTLLGAGAWTYLRKFLTHRFAGALVTGGALALTTVCYVAIGLIMSRFGRATPDSVAISYASGVLAVFIAFGMHLLVFEDITTELRASNDALARARDELRAMAVTDPLTSCYNRRFFDEIARHELEQHRRYALPLSLLFMDCDRFKAVNDSRGHETGDRVLRTIGQILRGSIREADYAFRWGGDEFLVMITAHEPQARAKAEEIRLLFQSSPILAELPEGVDLSFGCAAVPADTEDLRAVIEQADRDMYKRKRQVKSA